MMKFSFYCTEMLLRKIKYEWGEGLGRRGRVSANIERVLWAYFNQKEIPPMPPKEKGDGLR